MQAGPVGSCRQASSWHLFADRDAESTPRMATSCMEKSVQIGHAQSFAFSSSMHGQKQ